MKLNSISTIGGALSIFFLIDTASGYETETHAAITLKAYRNSVLAESGNGSVINRLGLDRLYPTSPFSIYWRTLRSNNSYYTDGGSTSGFQDGEGLGDSNRPEDFERCQMQEFKFDLVPVSYRLFNGTVSDGDTDAANDDTLPIQNWLVRGAIREDDMGRITYWLTDGTHCGLLWRKTLQHGNLGRPVNHFYDPFFDTGLRSSIPPVSGKRSVDWALGYVDSFASAPLNDSSRQNFYSYTDARNMFWWALTRQNNKHENLQYGDDRRSADAVDRMYLWATVFRSLGDVVHLLEDTAQPQHTRNDAHGGPFVSSEQKAFELYTNARVLGGGEVGTYVKSFYNDSFFSISAPPLGTYGAIMFATPARFFSTQASDPNQATRAGLADYTNRGFFTGGTRPGDETYGQRIDPLPPRDLTQNYTVAQTPCEGLQESGDQRLMSVLCKHYTHAVPDVANPTYLDALPPNYTLPPLLSESIISRVNFTLGLVSDVPETAIGIAELDTIGNLTIPRAVGYATGMLNFFFRGQLTLSSPPDGLYAVIDQGVPHEVSDGVPVMLDGKTTFGFNTVRVRVKNTTMMDNGGNPTLIDPSMGSVAQTMRGGIGPDGQANGYLVAIARYHRNPCYKADLTGELVTLPDANGQPISPSVVPSGCFVANTRTDYAEISVSKPIYLDPSGNLPGPGTSSSSCANVGNINTGASGTCANSSALMEFNFSGDAIPINATDLFLQVAYRGPLGEETDGIAFGSKDILEPNFYTQFNNTDFTFLSGVWTPDANVPMPPRQPAPIDPSIPASYYDTPLLEVSICFNQQRIAHMNQPNTLAARQYSRVAVLTDPTYLNLFTVTRTGLDTTGHLTSDGFMKPSQHEAATEQVDMDNRYDPDPITYYGRGTVLGFDFAQYYWAYDDSSTTQDQYIKVLTLSPALGDPQNGNIPTPIDIQFTSEPNSVCDAFTSLAALGATNWRPNPSLNNPSQRRSGSVMNKAKSF